MTVLPKPTSASLPSSPQGILERVHDWVTTCDHKKLGLLYIFSGLFFFLIGGIEAGIMRWQLAQPANDVVGPVTVNQMFTMHGTTMVFLAIMPLSAAFFNYLLPLQIGARDVAFPRMNALSLWTFFFGGILWITRCG